MSINSIKLSPLELLQASGYAIITSQVRSDFAGNKVNFNNAKLGVYQDALFTSNSDQINTLNTLHVTEASSQPEINCTNDARRAVNSIISFFQNNGKVILDSLKAPTARPVLDLIRSK